jgi:adenine deaminase
MTDLDALIAALPKAELHLHIEGTLEPEMMFALAQRNAIKLRFASVASLRAAYDFADLQGFLDLYYEGAGVLRTRVDFDDLARAYLDRMAAENVRHVEIFFDPQTHTQRGVVLADVVEGLLDALRRGARDHGITWRLIPCLLRHLDEADGMATLEALRPWLDRFAALGLDSAEKGNPPTKFTRVFARARALGLKTVAHAGEEGPPSYIADAIDHLAVSRIDHGVRCLEDPALTARLRALRMPLTVCPLSNVRLKVFKTLAEHNLRRLLDADLLVTVNADDPAYFGGYLCENYRQTAAALGLTAAQVITLAGNSFRASFLDDATKRARLADIATAARALGHIVN